MIIPCRLCGETTHNEDGSPTGTVYIYQRIDGKFKLARQLTLHVPMIYIHDTCLTEVSER